MSLLCRLPLSNSCSARGQIQTLIVNIIESLRVKGTTKKKLSDWFHLNLVYEISRADTHDLGNANYITSKINIVTNSDLHFGNNTELKRFLVQKFFSDVLVNQAYLDSRL